MSTSSHVSEPVPMKTVLSHILVPVVMGLIMCMTYLGGFHKPQPHHLPAAIVRQAQDAGPVAARVQQALGGAADVTTLPTKQAAVSALRHLSIDAAYVPGKGTAQLLTASGGSDSTQTVVEKMFRPVADAQHATLQIQDVAPVGSHDPIGQNGFFYLVGLTVAAYATAIGIGAAAATRPFVERIGLAVGAAVVISTLEMFIAAGMYDMFGGHQVAIWGLSLLYSGTVLAIGVGLHPVVGRFAALVYSAIFVALNFTSSGGVFTPSMQPGFYGWLHDFWIGSGFVEAIRRITYFPDAGIGSQLGILLSWFAVGLVCLAIGNAAEQRRVHEPRHAAGAHLARHEPAFDAATEEELEEDVAV